MKDELISKIRGFYCRMVHFKLWEPLKLPNGVGIGCPKCERVKFSIQFFPMMIGDEMEGIEEIINQRNKFQVN